jgi:hypothetical protein
MEIEIEELKATIRQLEEDIQTLKGYYMCPSCLKNNKMIIKEEELAYFNDRKPRSLEQIKEDGGFNDDELLPIQLLKH